MCSAVNRRRFLTWTGVVLVSAPVISSCAKDQVTNSAPKNTPEVGAAQNTPVVNKGGFDKNGKHYPYKDPVTGELLYHEPISFTPPPGLKRNPLTKPVNLLERQPPRVESRNGLLDVDLNIAYADVIVDGQKMNLRAYNGTFPGPTLVARPGDVLRIREINKLPPEPPGSATESHEVNGPHGANVVNLHTHGLNVSPDGNEDNVLIEIHPGETFAHEFHVPADHPTGTFWYHPHKHGSTACQVGSGMAGMLLLTDPQNDIRSVPEVGAAKEVILLFQELYIKTRPDGVGEVPGEPTSVDNYYYSNVIRNEITVNGVACTERGMDGSVVIPEIHMRPGEVQHWRMAHAGIFHNWPFTIEGHQSNIISYDGLTLEKPEVVSDFVFTSGQRRDILVQASMTPGTYAVKRKAYKQAEEVNTWPVITLFNLVVDGAPVKMKLPTKLNPPRDRLPYVRDDEITYKREAGFSFIDNTEKELFLFTVNNRVFNPGRIDFSSILGSAEEWIITNNPSSEHPYHIHVNWFQVLSTTDQFGKVTTYDPPIWMDTVNIPMHGKVRTRMRFQHFQGKSVLHCHFLPHEDDGMMSLVEILDGSPKIATITPTGDTIVSNDYENRVQARFLPNSVLANTQVTYQYLSSPNVQPLNPSPAVNQAPALPKNMADYNTFFKLEAQQGGKALSELNRPATIDVKYSTQQPNALRVETPQAEDLPPTVKVDPRSIQLYSYDENQKTWTTDGISVIARTDNLVTCSTMRLGKFAVTGKIIL